MGKEVVTLQIYETFVIVLFFDIDWAFICTV